MALPLVIANMSLLNTSSIVDALTVMKVLDWFVASSGFSLIAFKSASDNSTIIVNPLLLLVWLPSVSVYCRDELALRPFWIVIPDGENEEDKTTSVNVRFINPRSSSSVNDANSAGVVSIVMFPCRVMFTLGSVDPSYTVPLSKVKNVSFIFVANI